MERRVLHAELGEGGGKSEGGKEVTPQTKAVLVMAVVFKQITLLNYKDRPRPLNERQTLTRASIVVGCSPQWWKESRGGRNSSYKQKSGRKIEKLIRERNIRLPMEGGVIQEERSTNF